MKKLTLFVAALLFSINAGLANAQDQTTTTTSSFTADQQTQIQSIVHDYILAHPEIVIQAVQILQNKQAQQQQTQAKDAFARNMQQFLDAPGSPVIGNPKGTVTMVAFFDYQCPYCKRMTATINQMVLDNPELRIVFKELPIFGESSSFAARAALAAQMQGKYHALHDALMKAPTPFTNDEILTEAKSAGLDVTKLQKDMNSNQVNQEISENLNLANDIGFGGTPAFIISSTNFAANNTVTAGTKTFFIPGVASLQTLDALVKQAAQPNPS